MTFPAFRYRDRAGSQFSDTDGIPVEERKHPNPEDMGPPFTWAFDIDDTITSAPHQYRRLAEALKADGDHIVCVTGHGPKETREHLLQALGFPFDEIIIVDPGEFGEGKAKALKALGAFMLFDNEVAFGPEIIKVCPLALQYVEPPGDSHPKADAKKAAKALKAT
jgi:hypothetical protein